MLKIIFLFILLFYIIPSIISSIGEIYASHYHDYELLNLDIKEDLRDAKTVGDYLYCLQNNFFPVTNILFMLMYICMFLYDFLKWLFKFITKITKLDILWKKIMNIKIRK